MPDVGEPWCLDHHTTGGHGGHGARTVGCRCKSRRCAALGGGLLGQQVVLAGGPGGEQFQTIGGRRAGCGGIDLELQTGFRRQMLRWLTQQGRQVIPKSVTPSRIAENFDVFGFELTAEQLAAIDGLDTGIRGGPAPEDITLEKFGRDIPEA